MNLIPCSFFSGFDVEPYPIKTFAPDETSPRFEDIQEASCESLNRSPEPNPIAAVDNSESVKCYNVRNLVDQIIMYYLKEYPAWNFSKGDHLPGNFSKTRNNFSGPENFSFLRTSSNTGGTFKTAAWFFQCVMYKDNLL